MSEPHIVHDNVPKHGIIVGMYVCIIDPRLSHSGLRDPCMPLNALCIQVY